ncbi:cell division protein [Psychrobacillus glaciei]|uniref:Cell division protein n=1 Tax=Psychrobacillus glaciei TaxID=2283160 RepID=A0A5J6SUE3_9BACI|nr:SRPBCC family protein [Psychrobacillus glaciei]QFG00635.1 cell division protein [Psychrobacillus glaciei]
MPVIKHTTYMEAPINKCFDFARHVEIHTKTTRNTNEKAVTGATKGLLNLGESITWEATHFCVKQRLTAKIIEMNEPYKFVDVMVKGAFHSFTHTHEFEERGSGTLMKDTFEYKSPFGLVGKIADKLFLEKYMKNFIITRAIELKKIAEMGERC